MRGLPVIILVRVEGKKRKVVGTLIEKFDKPVYIRKEGEVRQETGVTQGSALPQGMPVPEGRDLRKASHDSYYRTPSGKRFQIKSDRFP